MWAFDQSCVCVCSRVEQLYAFFVQWSPDVYGREAREQGFVVVEKDELDMIDNFFSDPASCSWEVSRDGVDLLSWHVFKTLKMSLIPFKNELKH